MLVVEARSQVNTRNDVLIATDVRSQNHSKRLVEFGEALPPGTRLTFFYDDKPHRLFTVIAFWIDKVSGVALDLENGVPPTKSKTRKAESIYCFTCPLRKRMKAAGVSGDRIRQDLILVSGPINNTAFVPPLPDQLAVFEGASDARTEELMNSYGLDLLGPPLS